MRKINAILLLIGVSIGSVVCASYPADKVTIEDSNMQLTFLANQHHEPLSHCITLTDGTTPLNSYAFDTGHKSLTILSHYGSHCDDYAFTIADITGDVCTFVIAGSQLVPTPSAGATNLCAKVKITTPAPGYTFNFND